MPTNGIGPVGATWRTRTWAAPRGILLPGSAGGTRGWPTGLAAHAEKTAGIRPIPVLALTGPDRDR